MRVVALFRVSTEKQAEEGASLDAQQRKFRELAKLNRWKMVAEFRGCESASQAATERRVLQDVLACIQAEEPDAIWVYEQSRLTRGDELEVALLLRELRERKLKIIVGSVVRDLGSIDERFMVGIQSLVDRAEYERIRERMIRGRREKARQGKKNCGKAPFGYMNPPPGDPRRGTLQIVPEQAAVVRRIFEEAAEGRSWNEIARRLNADAAPSARGGRWGPGRIWNIIKNPVYVGTLASNVWVEEPGTRWFRYDLSNPKAIIVENAHAAIIPRPLWDAVHSMPRSPRTAKPRMLVGLLWVNGYRYSGNTTRGSRFYSVRDGSSRPWLVADSLENLVWQAFVSLASKPAFVAAMAAQAGEKRSAKRAETDMKRLQATIEKRRNRLDGLIDMRADGEIERDEYLRKTAELKKEIAEAESSLRRLAAERTSTDITHAERVVKAVQTLLGGHRKLNSEQKRMVLRSIVRRIDATTRRTRHGQLHNSRGKFAARSGPKWEVKDLFFRLTIPAEDRAGSLSPRSTCRFWPGWFC